MKIISKFHSRLKGEVKAAAVVFVIFLLFLIFAFDILIPQFVTRDLADLYCDNVFEWVALAGNIISGLAIGSVTENIVVTASLIGTFLVFYAIYRFIRTVIGRGRACYGRRAYTVLVVILAISVIMSAAYNLMHGFNYKRTPVYTRLGIVLDSSNTRPYRTYLDALNWAYGGMVRCRANLGEDFSGVAHMSTSFEDSVADANYLLDSLSYTYGLSMSKTFIRAKAVSLSSLWSSTHIVGVYDPFLGEVNINTDYMDILDFPQTLCHELAHAKGYARESDANIIAALALIHSDRDDFRYAGYYYIFSNLYPTVAEYAQAEGQNIPNYFGDELTRGVIRDIQASVRYWDYIDNRFFAETVEEVSEEVNNTFLEANGQEGGTQTYHVSPNFFVEFYAMYVAGSEYA